MQANLPIFNIVLTESDESGISAIALVQDPAIEVMWQAYSKEEPVRMTFAQDGDKMRLTGPFLIPDKLIYRYDEKMGEYYVKFSKETIAELANKFASQSRNTNLNLDHTKQSVPAYIAESWIVDNPDKIYNYGFTIEGLLGLSLSSIIRESFETNILKVITELEDNLGIKAENITTDEWTSISDEDDLDIPETDSNFDSRKLVIYRYISKHYGADMVGPHTRPYCKKLVELTKNKYLTRTDINTLTDRVSSENPASGNGRYSVFKYAGGNNCHHYWQKSTTTVDDETKQIGLNKMEKQKFEAQGNATAADGSTIVLYSNTDFTQDQEVYILDADGNQSPAPDNDYTLEDGTVLKVSGGKITEVVAVDTAMADAPVDTPAPENNAGPSIEELATMIDGFKEVLVALEARITELETNNSSQDMEAELSAIKTQLSTMPAVRFATVKKTDEPTKVVTKEEKFQSQIERAREIAKTINK